MGWCDKCIYSEKDGVEAPCNRCISCNDGQPTQFEPKRKPKPKTKADQIRKMSNEQLAKLFKQVCVERNIDATEEEWLTWLGWEVKSK